MSPRLMSMSSVSCMTMDMGGNASFVFPSGVSMECIVVVNPEGSIFTWSPGL